MKNYNILNEVLLNWGDPDENIQDNNIIKSSDIKSQINQYFIYRVKVKPSYIHIFDDGTKDGWPEFEKYKDKVFINDKHVELDREGWTIDTFDPGEYRVYIKDIDQMINCKCMFYECTQLVSAFIPNIGSIGACTFKYCNNLISVVISNSTISIHGDAFYNCISLTNITIPNSVTHIGSRAFSGCTALTSVTIPNSVTYIGDDAFRGCNNLKTVYIEDINKFNQIKFGNEYANPTYYGAKLIELKK